MKIEEKEIQQALDMARSHRWPHGIPVVRARLRLAINSLLAQDKDIFSKDAAEIVRILRCNKNSGIRKILHGVSVESFAFSIYTALN